MLNETIANFKASSNRPFPMDLSLEWKSLVVVILVVIFVVGLFLRAVVISYMKHPENKQHPINSLLMLDQVFP